MTRFVCGTRGYPNPPMAPPEKPYRVYRGGRVKGKVPTLPRPGRAQAASTNGRGRMPGGIAPRRRRRFGWGRRIGLVLGVLVLLHRVCGSRLLPRWHAPVRA